MRNAGIPVGRGDARQDDVPHRCGFRGIDRRRALQDLFLRVDGEVGLEWSRDDEEAVHIPKERGEACALGEVALRAFDTGGSEGLQIRAVSSEADDSMSSLKEAPCDRAALLSRRPRHQNRLRLCHAIVSRSSDVRSTCRLDHARTTLCVQVPKNLDTACLAARRPTLGWGFEPQITRLGGGCPFRARLPERCAEVLSHH